MENVISQTFIDNFHSSRCCQGFRKNNLQTVVFVLLGFRGPDFTDVNALLEATNEKAYDINAGKCLYVYGPQKF